MEGLNNAVQLTTTAQVGKNKKVKTDKIYKQKSVTKDLTEKEQAEKMYGMKFKGE